MSEQKWGGVVTLRISIQDAKNALTLKLEGRVAGAFADELNRTWRALVACLEQKELHVDLCGVMDADAGGRRILAEIHQETGADFLANTPLAKYLAREACRSNHAEAREVT